MAAPAQRSGDPTAAAWEALGTSVVLRVTDPVALGGARGAVEAQLAAIDRACSRFREDSDLARVNAGAGTAVAVDPLLLDALELAIRAARLTGGDVDPTMGEALELAGYDRDWRELPAAVGEPPAPARLRVRRRPGWMGLEIDRARGRVRLPSGVKLDLGATAKAWAADRAAAAAAAGAGCGVLVGIGGDIATAGPAPAEGWLVHVTDDHRSPPTAPGQTIRITSGAIATSSTAVRRWSHAGTTMSHVLDPRTGAPISGRWRTASVAAASCADANIASTAALVKGAKAAAWLTGAGLPARLVGIRGEVLLVGEWPAPLARAPGGAPRRESTSPAEAGRERRDERGRPVAA